MTALNERKAQAIDTVVEFFNTFFVCADAVVDRQDLAKRIEPQLSGRVAVSSSSDYLVEQYTDVAGFTSNPEYEWSEKESYAKYDSPNQSNCLMDFLIVDGCVVIHVQGDADADTGEDYGGYADFVRVYCCFKESVAQSLYSKLKNEIQLDELMVRLRDMRLCVDNLDDEVLRKTAASHVNAIIKASGLDIDLCEG